jgi:methylthioribulose-1-phosphate dehydratase
LEGFEVLKSLSRVTTSQHLEWVPILENTEGYPTTAGTIGRVLRAWPEVHAILLRKHGLYTWGATVEEAARHVEIFELLFEVLVRKLHIINQVDTNKIPGPYS